ncbi:hypothetical protein GIB67_036254, partial [Kingdonia uniflora]
ITLEKVLMIGEWRKWSIKGEAYFCDGSLINRGGSRATLNRSWSVLLQRYLILGSLSSMFTLRRPFQINVEATVSVEGGIVFSRFESSIKYTGQIKEEEKKDECFSPQFDNYLANFHNSKDLIIHTCSTANINSPTIVEHGNINLSFSDKTTVFPGETNSRHLEATNALVVEENTSQKGRDHEAVFVSDVLCIACKQILFRPTVLNCGHVYCESCIAAPVGDLRCQLCECSHPEGLPKVCLELDHFLEERFPEEYALKKEAVRLQLIECQVGIPSTGILQHHLDFFHEAVILAHNIDNPLIYQGSGVRSGAIQPQKQGAKSSSSSNQKYLSWFRERGLKVHVGVGCDYCGMFPIIGKRYRCKDCVEKIGFDLCGECYNSRSKLPGRFNQQHTPEHKFQLERSTLRNMLLSFVSEQSNDGTTVPPLSAEEAEAAHAINEAVEEGEGPNSGI